MRAVDEERISETKLLMLQGIEAETKVMNIIQRCYDDMRKAVDSISPSNDSASVVEHYRFVFVKFCEVFVLLLLMLPLLLLFDT